MKRRNSILKQRSSTSKDPNLDCPRISILKTRISDKTPSERDSSEDKHISFSSLGSQSSIKSCDDNNEMFDAIEEERPIRPILKWHRSLSYETLNPLKPILKKQTTSDDKKIEIRPILKNTPHVPTNKIPRQGKSILKTENKLQRRSLSADSENNSKYGKAISEDDTQTEGFAKDVKGILRRCGGYDNEYDLMPSISGQTVNAPNSLQDEEISTMCTISVAERVRNMETALRSASTSSNGTSSQGAEKQKSSLQGEQDSVQAQNTSHSATELRKNRSVSLSATSTELNSERIENSNNNLANASIMSHNERLTLALLNDNAAVAPTGAPRNVAVRARAEIFERDLINNALARLPISKRRRMHSPPFIERECQRICVLGRSNNIESTVGDSIIERIQQIDEIEMNRNSAPITEFIHNNETSGSCVDGMLIQVKPPSIEKKIAKIKSPFFGNCQPLQKSQQSMIIYQMNGGITSDTNRTPSQQREQTQTSRNNNNKSDGSGNSRDTQSKQEPSTSGSASMPSTVADIRKKFMCKDSKTTEADPQQNHKSDKKCENGKLTDSVKRPFNIVKKQVKYFENERRLNLNTENAAALCTELVNANTDKEEDVKEADSDGSTKDETGKKIRIPTGGIKIYPFDTNEITKTRARQLSNTTDKPETRENSVRSEGGYNNSIPLTETPSVSTSGSVDVDELTHLCHIEDDEDDDDGLISITRITSCEEIVLTVEDFQIASLEFERIYQETEQID